MYLEFTCQCDSNVTMDLIKVIVNDLKTLRMGRSNLEMNNSEPTISVALETGVLILIYDKNLLMQNCKSSM